MLPPTLDRLRARAASPDLAARIATMLDDAHALRAEADALEHAAASLKADAEGALWRAESLALALTRTFGDRE